MRKKSRITGAVKEIDAYLISQNYSEITRKNYRSACRRFIRYCNSQNIDSTLESSIQSYIAYTKANSATELSKSHLQNLKQAAYYWAEFQSTGEIVRYKKRRTYTWAEPLEPYFLECLEEYSKTRRNITTRNVRTYLNNFAQYLDQHGIDNLSKLVGTDIIRYIENLKDVSAASISRMIPAIRFFLKFVAEKHYVDKDLSNFLPTAHYKKGNIPQTYSKTEIKQLLNSIDRSTSLGKRNYAIFLLATRLGMRAGDIKLLQLGNLHWDKNMICFKQHKTNIIQTLPILSDVGEAIIDYLQNGRPKVSSKYIFISHRVPYNHFGEKSTFHEIMDRYLQDCDLFDKDRRRGLHTLRHSLAGELLKENVTLPVISEILGHSSTAVTKTYLKIDLPQLRKCSLEVPLCG